MTLHAYRNEESRTNRVVSLLLARNSFDPFQTPHGIAKILFLKIYKSKSEVCCFNYHIPLNHRQMQLSVALYSFFQLDFSQPGRYSHRNDCLKFRNLLLKFTSLIQIIEYLHNQSHPQHLLLNLLTLWAPLLFFPGLMRSDLLVLQQEPQSHS
jgi:hypothetical protein